MAANPAGKFGYSTGFSYELDGVTHNVKGGNVYGDKLKDVEAKAKQISLRMASQFAREHPDIHMRGLKSLAKLIQDTTSNYYPK